jgi:hypothetical protein
MTAAKACNACVLLHRPLRYPPEDSAESTGGRLGWPLPSSRRGCNRLLSPRWAVQAYSSQFRRTPRGRQPAVTDESARQPGVNSGTSAGHPLRPDDSCGLNESGESLVRVFLRATKVAEGHARESGVNPRPWEPSPPQRPRGVASGNPQAPRGP